MSVEEKREENGIETDVADSLSAHLLPQSVEENPALLNKVYLRALQLIVEKNSVSLTMLQKKLDISYNKAWQILEWMCACGYITAFEGSKPRKVLITKEHFESIYGEFV